MKSIKFDLIRPGQRFWTDAFDDQRLVEHIRLFEPAMVQVEHDTGIGPMSEWEVEWNCVELSEGRLGLILDHVDVWIDNGENHPISWKHQYGDGTKPPLGKVVQTLEIVDEFRMKVHSLNGVSADTLKDQIQDRYKVDKITHLERLVIVG